MKSILFAFAALLAFWLSPARAEEILIPVPREWTGFYGGVNAGYAQGSHTQYDDLGNSGSQEMDGSLVGLQFGYNRQIGDIVLGAEADFQLSNQKGLFGFVPYRWGCGWIACASEVPWFGTARLRAGYAAGDLLPYVTAGLAYGAIHSEIKWAGPDWQQNDQTLGWTAGAGLEIALSERLSTKIEYLYTDLGKTQNQGPWEFAAAVDYGLLRLGLNFALAEPVVIPLELQDTAGTADPRGWAGFHAGALGGYAYGIQVQHDYGGSSQEHRIDGAGLGLAVGYDWQFDRFVLGVEGDFQLSNVSSVFGTDWQWSCVWFGCKTEVDWFGSARLRAGYGTDQLLGYVTGGIAAADVRSEIIYAGPDWELSERQLGWTLGAGIEYAVSDRLSARLEYLYYDFGRTDDTGYFDFASSVEFGQTRAGLMYRF